jgi:hypothetical protein
VSTIECVVVNKIRNHTSSISFKHVFVFYGNCALISPNHTPIKYRDVIKKSNPITPIYLSERHEFYFPVVGGMDGVVDFFGSYVYWRSCYSILDQ